MVIFTKVTVNGADIEFQEEMEVQRTIGDFNSTSSFSINISNYDGRFDNAFSLNDEVVVYADKDVNPAVTKIFVGVIENIKFNGREQDEKLTISGRDYGAVLQDVTIQPIIFKERDAGEIVKIVIENNAFGIVTTNNVDTATGVIIDKIGFNHRNIFDALRQLAELANYQFWIDVNKDVHFEPKGNTSSGLTFDNTNVTQANFTTDDSQLFNKVWVYGDRILTGATDIGGIGAGSVLKLTDKPHNTNVFVAGVLQQTGGIIGMNDPLTTSGLKYVVDFNEKHIVFVSGTAAGDNIPSSGTSNVQVDYERSSPLLKFVQDGDSIASFGPKVKVITDTTIKDFVSANDNAVAFLAEHKDPIIQGTIDIYNVLAITPGQTCVVNIPFHGISSETYTILSASYKFNPENNLGNNVLRVSLNKKVDDFTDVMKDQMLRMRDVEAGPLEGNFTRLETAVDTIDAQQHWDVWGVNIGDNFVFHSDKHGRLNDPNSRVGRIDAGSALLVSGGDF